MTDTVKIPLRTRMIWIGCFAAFYVLTAMPVGMFLYAVKSNANIDIFARTGFHTYAECLRQQAALIGLPKDDKK